MKKETLEEAVYYNIKVTTINNILHGRAKKTKAGKSFINL
jgi:hypothetical protein